MKRLLFIFFSLLFFALKVHSQEADSSSLLSNSDTTSYYLDSSSAHQYSQLGDSKSLLLQDGKRIVFDVQQIHSPNRSAIVFFLLMTMLLILTYIKLAFNKDVEELFQSFTNSNIAQQIFRTQSNEISFSSFLLHVNFIIALSLYVQFIFLNYYHVIALKNFSSILILIFLFTFFYLAKVVALKFIGAVFEVNAECNEYIFNFSTVCKMIGLTLIPALFIFYTAPEKFFNLIFFITVFILIVLALIFVWRGLSTGYKLLYRSVYHFFIYVCVVEISPIFLLFKLLTKTIP